MHMYMYTCIDICVYLCTCESILLLACCITDSVALGRMLLSAASHRATFPSAERMCWAICLHASRASVPEAARVNPTSKRAGSRGFATSTTRLASGRLIPFQPPLQTAWLVRFDHASGWDRSCLQSMYESSACIRRLGHTTALELRFILRQFAR